MERATAGEIPLALRPFARTSVFQLQNRTDADLGRQTLCACHDRADWRMLLGVGERSERKFRLRGDAIVAPGGPRKHNSGTRDFGAGGKHEDV